MNRVIAIVLSTYIAMFISKPICLAQMDKNIYHSVGMTAITDYIKSPVINVSVPIHDYANNTVNYSIEKARAYVYTLGTIIYRFRYNIFDISENRAIGISITPSIGMSFINVHSTNSQGIGNQHLSIPLILEYEFGAGSTYNTIVNYGGLFGIGVDYCLLPFTWGSPYASNSGEGVKNPKFSYLQLGIITGYRFWSARNKLQEINLKAGIGPSYTAPPSYDNENDGISFSARLAWLRFINY